MYFSNDTVMFFILFNEEPMSNIFGKDTQNDRPGREGGIRDGPGFEVDMRDSLETTSDDAIVRIIACFWNLSLKNFNSFFHAVSSILKITTSSDESFSNATTGLLFCD
jgi:hypothetical protein